MATAPASGVRLGLSGCGLRSPSGVGNIKFFLPIRYSAFENNPLVLYLTAVHVVLQAEPRYSIAYRPEEVLLAVTALAWLAARVVRLRRPPAAADATPAAVDESRSAEVSSAAAGTP
jgi:hypothetical protein